MRSLFIFLLGATLLFANMKSIEADYKVSYGIFGEFGIAKAILKIDDNNEYLIKIEAKATGMIKFLSNGKEESYLSKGTVIDGLFVPKIYIKTTKNNIKSYIKKYTIDHKNKKIYLYKETNRFQHGEWTKEVENSELPTFEKEDMLSLFFNINQYIKYFIPGIEYGYNTVSTNEERGHVNVIIPAGEKMQSLQNALETDEKTKFIVYLNQKIFSSQRGELFISLKENGIANKAVLKDVLLFGDIVGELTETRP